MNTDGIKETWDDVIAHNEQQLADFEQRVAQSRYSELKLWKIDQLFTIRKDIPGAPGLWELWTPQDTYVRSTLDEVLRLAEPTYPEIYSWLPEFNDR